MKATRRGFIKVIGGGVVGAALVGGGLQGCDRMPASAVAPWMGPATKDSDPRRRALSWALLAPNPHNMQPWQVDLRQREDEILLHVDRTRLLPETDPFARQIVIGHGTFIELLVLAAGADGYRCEIDYFPQGLPAEGEVDDRPLARIRFKRDSTARDPLFTQIPHRRSTKEPYQQKPLQPDHARALQAAHRGSAQLSITGDAQLAAGLRGITERAMLIELQTPRTLKESIDRLRIGADAIAAQPDGIELHGPFFWWLSKLGLMTTEKAMTPGTMAYQGGIDYALGWARATPAFGWLTTAANDRVSQIEAGRAYVRLNLKAAELGVAMHPVSQVLQEYPEMADLQREFLGVIGATSGQTVQMLFRLGYSAPVPPSPRRGLDALLMS